MKYVVLFWMIILCVAFSYKNNTDIMQDVVKVEIHEVNGVSSFYVNDSIFKIKGVGLNYQYGHDFDELAETGANAIRTWGTKHADTILKAARKFNFKVALGIDIGKELHGFDYNDTVAVAKQFEQVKAQIKKYKGHPNLLCWVIGNELNLLFDEDGELKNVNPKVYDAVEEVIQYVNKIDPYHPTTVTFAGVNNQHLKIALERMPSIDFVSVQVYADLENVEKRMKETGASKPYLVTETGPKGHWEMPKTEWGREIEEASGPKVDGIVERMNKGLINNKSGKCLGGFAFVWGNKHERTPTWYGMHHPDGKQTAYVDELTKLWKGSYPLNRAPRVDSLILDGKRATDNVYLKPNRIYSARVYASDPNNESLLFNWEVAKEVSERSQGGELESKPARIPVEIIKEERGKLTFIAPNEIGEYRLFVNVHDENNKAGNANIPFYIKN